MCINIKTSPMLQQTTLALFNAGPPPCALCAIFKAVKDRDELLLNGVTVGNVCNVVILILQLQSLHTTLISSSCAPYSHNNGKHST